MPLIVNKLFLRLLVLLLAGLFFCSGLLAQYSLKDMKREFRLNDSLRYSDNTNPVDFSKLASKLESYVQKDSLNPEAWYFLGYTYSRMGCTFSTDKGLSGCEENPYMDKLIRAFQNVNRLQPLYKGEKLQLDPYSKIQSEYATQALIYDVRKEYDKAKAYRDKIKKIGVMNPFKLEWGRYTLDNCSQGAVLISSGDISTFTLMYLQQEEHYRTDVAVMDKSLLEVPEYTRYIQSKNPGFELGADIQNFINTDSSTYRILSQDTVCKLDIHEVNPYHWPAQSWEFGIKRRDQILLTMSDLVLLSFMENNRCRKELCFTDEAAIPDYLKRYCFTKGLVFQLNPTIKDRKTMADGAAEFFEKFYPKEFKDKMLQLSPDQGNWVFYYINLYITQARLAREQGKEFDSILDRLEETIAFEKVPLPVGITPEKIRDYIKTFRN